MNRHTLRRTGAGACAAALLLALTACATNPVTQKREFMLLSPQDELALGRQTDPQILAEYGRYEDAELTAYVAALGKRLGAVSHQPNIAYEVKVLDSPVVNAFAVPGGFVYLTRGILAYLNDEAELAGVMAHEVGHIAARHSAQQQSRAQAMQLGLGIGSILSETFRQYAGLAQAGLSLLFLSFSRENERQADDLGVLYSSRTGYDAHKMANLFVTLGRLNPESGQDGLPAFFSTHPNPPDRIAAIHKAAEAWQKSNPQAQLAVNREQYLRSIEGIVVGEDPRRGYVAGQVFYHPELRFQFPVPAGWTVNNTASQVQVFTEQQDAVLLLSIASGGTPAEAAGAFVNETGASVLSSEALRVNGLPAQRMLCEVSTEQGVLRVLSCFIQKEQRLYAFLGYTAQAAFDGYQPSFEKSVGGFKNLTDSGRINVKPSRLALRKVQQKATLRQALQGFGVPNDRLEAYAILNGMNLEDPLPAGTLVKIAVQ